MEEKNQRSHDEYSRQYDTLTIKRFLDREKAWAEASAGEESKALLDCTHKLILYFDKGEEWKAKKSTIQKWMDRDRLLDELYDNAQAPSGICCTTCGDELKMDFKTLTEKNGNDDVLFFYSCSKKHRGRAFYSDGSEYISKPSLCLECGKDALDSESKKENDVLTIIDTCVDCTPYTRQSSVISNTIDIWENISITQLKIPSLQLLKMMA